MKATWFLIRDGVRVVRVRWQGGWYKGRLTLDAVAGNKQAVDQVRGIMDARQDLGDVCFQSAGPAFTTKGWVGLEGNYGALRIAIEAIGMRIGGLSVIA